MPGGDVEGDVVLVQAVRRDTAVDAAVRRIDDHDLARQAQPGVRDLGLLPQRPRVAAADGARQRVHRPQGHRTADAVRFHAQAPLEFPQRTVRQRAEDSVDRSGQQPEDDEPLLQRRDVVAAHEGSARQHQRAVAQAPACALQRPQRLGTDHAVGHEAATLLEGTDGGLERDVEDGLVGGVERMRGDPLHQATERDDLVAAIFETERPLQGQALMGCCTRVSPARPRTRAAGSAWAARR